MVSTTTSPSVLPSWAWTTRRIVGVARLVLGVFVFVAIAYQIQDRLANNVFRPGEYFAFFTIQTCMMFVVVLIASGVFALRQQVDTRLLTIVRMCAVAFTIVTGIVYNVMLRDLVPTGPDAGYVWPVWPNELLHVWLPILLVLDWFLTPGRHTLRLRAMWWVLVYPLAWIAFTLVRGLATNWWPYPFLDPSGSLGWAGVVAYIVGIAAFLALCAFIEVLVAVLWARRRRA